MTAVPAVPGPVIEALEWQRFGMDNSMGSPLYKRLLDITIADCGAGGPCAQVLVRTPDEVDPTPDALALRFLGGLHRLVLDGRAPELAAFFPSVGGRFDGDQDPHDAFLGAVVEFRDELVDALGRTVQTNEVGRSAALLVGFLAVAGRSGLPLRCLEIGASAGLNLRWDQYRYEGGADGTAWGTIDSRLRFADVYREPLPRLDIDALVVDRRGCDRAPIDLTADGAVLALRSFVWPDQVDRLTILDAAIALAPDVPVTVDRADAAEWLQEQLSESPAGVATVVYHSIVWQYLPLSTRERINGLLTDAGRRATARSPLAYVRMEPGEDPTRGAELRLTCWPPGKTELLARSGYHGRPVRVHR